MPKGSESKCCDRFFCSPQVSCRGHPGRPAQLWAPGPIPPWNTFSVGNPHLPRLQNRIPSAGETFARALEATVVICSRVSVVCDRSMDLGGRSVGVLHSTSVALLKENFPAREQSSLPATHCGRISEGCEHLTGQF